MALLPSFVVRRIFRLSVGPKCIGFDNDFFSTSLRAQISINALVSIKGCATYFSLSPTPALDFFPWTDTVASSKPHAEAAAQNGEEAASNAKAKW